MFKLLSPGHTNTKINKNDKERYVSTILHLAPSRLSGHDVCPAASRGCIASCLNTAGLGGVYASIQEARIRKTQWLFNDRPDFMRNLVGDLNKLYIKALNVQKFAVCRLNGTSDIDWENIPALNGLTLFELFPDVQFYDYTKRADRIIKNRLENYHLTFSRSECNDRLVGEVLSKGFNVAVVFDKQLPETMNYGKKSYKVISGDNTDLRFTDPVNVIIGLTAKGKAKKDTSGFVIGNK